ncbi:hypothetical protein TanjilG_01323 [Lupinus angustifolius]|uniref:F-box domain-containing protein n=1 Tax=Lupinus angustifolius TaxID=3871 RepID=A0A4P1REF3_LUPAN|nr:hypothetical protein TanjilG_01323 [Lupinus angustifolius]
MMPPSPIITLHPDIINSHILSRLDAESLSSAASSSSYLRRLSTENNHLWHTLTTNTWPSLNDPLTSSLISTFPAAHFSIFSDSFPSPSIHPHRPIPIPSELISAVDIYYEGKAVFSRVLRTDTNKGWFHFSPLWIDLLKHDEVVPTQLKLPPNDDVQWLNHLQHNLTLSWIIIDPILKRAANLSSQTAVSARWQWLTEELEVVYAVVFEEEEVMCTVKVTCCGKTMGEMEVREVSMKMEDMDGRHVIGKDSMVIMQRAMESVKRKRVDGKERES